MKKAYNLDVCPNASYVSESVFGPNVEVGEEEVKSVVRGNDGNVLPDLNQEYVDDAESFYVPPSHPHYTYGTYPTQEGDYKDFQQAAEDEAGAGDDESDDNEDGAGDEETAYEGVHIKEEPNPDVSYETNQLWILTTSCHMSMPGVTYLHGSFVSFPTSILETGSRGLGSGVW